MVGERPANVVLVGMMGSGKTSIGRHLAEMLEMSFCDTDEHVQQATGSTIGDLFAEVGEEAFRNHESAALVHCLERACVVATGGGVVLREENRLLLTRDGVYVAWLDASPEDLAARLAGVCDRPLLSGDALGTLRRLDAERRALYTAVASIRIDTTDKNPGEVCNELVAWWETCQ
jgi:shikimate kinase